MTRRYEEERGATLILAAVVIVAMFALAGLVIDGGRAYADRRQVQNAADAAALAGAGALNTIINNSSGDAAVIRTAVENAYNKNRASGSTSASFTCKLVGEDNQPISDCPTSPSTLPAGTAGVAVDVTDDQDTSFMRVVGVSSFSTSAAAAAQVQALRSGQSPFILCADQPQLETFAPATSPAPRVLNADDSINLSAIGQIYVLHDSQSNGSNAQLVDCGNPNSNWKGLAQEDYFPIPGYWDADNGTHAGPTRQYLANSTHCGSATVGCKIMVPLCSGFSGGQMYCSHMGAFEITDAGSNYEYGKFLGAVTATSGDGGGIPVAGESRIIKLSS